MSPEDVLKSKSMASAQPGRVAVALQSSFLGFASHAGFINSLLDSGIRPDKISGSSSGALVAAAYAGGLEQKQLRDFVLNKKLINAFWEWSSFFRAPAVFGFYRGQGVLRGKKAINYLRDKLPESQIENCQQAELSIAVTNITRMQGQIISTGEIASYVIASCAVSPIIRAQMIDGNSYLDGGFTDGAPFRQWIDDPDIDTILIHNIDFDPPVGGEDYKYSNFISCWAAAHQIVHKELDASRIAAAEAAGKRVIVHHTLTPRPRFFSPQKQFEANYQAAYQSWLKDCCL
ncbi:MAG: patatin-like phospholipase family protein [Verrucomicrobiota bacterium]